MLVVDGSAAVRQRVVQLLATHPKFQLDAAVEDPYQAAERMRQQVPDVILLAANTPRMSGLAFLRRVMSQHPVPVVMRYDSIAQRDSLAAQAGTLGARGWVVLEPGAVARLVGDDDSRLLGQLQRAAAVRGSFQPLRSTAGKAVPKLAADVVLPPPGNAPPLTREKLVVVGSSTGGTDALRVLLAAMPADMCGIVIVQHMPHDFTALLAEQLNAICPMEVREARHGDAARPGRVLVAPAGRHLLVRRRGDAYQVEVVDGPPVTRHLPSVDVLFRSAASAAGPNCVGVILTGMGDDGARCMVELRAAGAVTIAQDEASCVVFGMPKEAIRRNAVQWVLPLERIGPKVVQLIRSIRSPVPESRPTVPQS